MHLKSSAEVSAMQFEDTAFPDIRIMLDDSGAFAGILTPDGIEASAEEAAFLMDWRVLSTYDEACRSLRRILVSQLAIDLPRGFIIDVDTEDLTVFCTQLCPVEQMDAYLERKRGRVSSAADIWRRERPWDTNPMTASQAAALNLAFDADTGLIGTDGHFNDGRELYLPSSVDGKRVTAVKTSAMVSYTYLERIVIPDSVKYFEPYAFYDKVHLKYANIPDGMEIISEGAFGRCRALSAITIPKSVREIRPEAFYQCSSLDTVVIPDSVEAVGRCAFISVPHVIYHGAAKGFPWGATTGN
jgi:hypothetical protein